MKKVSISSPASSKTLAAGSASIAALLSASAANATIIYFDTPITSDNDTAGIVGWNIDGVGGYEAILLNSSISSTLYKKIGPARGVNFYVVSSTGSLLGLAAGQTISEYDARGFTAFISPAFDNGSLTNAINITSGVSTYIGFRFKPSETMLYGWANVTLTNGDGFGTFVINEWAYDPSGSSIQTGQTPVPEPATYALGLGALALGAAGLRRTRQRKRLAA